MVQRIQATGLDEFPGTIRLIEVVEGNFGPQYHLELVPTDKDLIKGKTGAFHEYIRITPKATDAEVPEGSILDLYLREVESTFKEAKKAETVLDALNCMKGKKIVFRKKILGKAFGGHNASEHWVPVKLA